MMEHSLEDALRAEFAALGELVAAMTAEAAAQRALAEAFFSGPEWDQPKRPIPA